MTKTYNAVIIDDEPIAIDVIVNHLQNIPNFEVAGTFTNAIEATQTLHNQQIDLLFLDIEMPGISGIDFLKSLQVSTSVIFTTAYRNYAVEAFDLEVIDYLLKPISFKRFLKAINRFYSFTERKTPVIEDNNQKEIIELKADKKIYKVNTNEILYIESVDDYIKVHTSEQKILVYQRLHQIEKQLKSASFLRIHRSFIVNTCHISAYSCSHVEIGATTLPIGRTYRDSASENLKS